MNNPDIRILTLPQDYACYLINGDTDILTDEEVGKLMKLEERHGECVGCSDIPFFQHGHDLNLNQGATCLEFYFRPEVE